MANDGIGNKCVGSSMRKLNVNELFTDAPDMM